MSNNPTNQTQSIDPIVNLVKPLYRPLVNFHQVKLILKLRKEGLTYREISKRYYAITGIDLSTQRISMIVNRFKEGLKYV